MRWFWARFILLACGSSALAEPPPLMLWAWEQAIDLRFLAGRSDVGVAYLAATAFVDKAGVRVKYRGVPMRAPEGMYRMPVLRIEGREVIRDRTPLIELCERLIRDSKAEALQIDFDVPVVLRPLYRGLIEELRKRHGAKLYLSMTVLAEWCDLPWFAGMPVDEHVVMLFRMGKSGKDVVRKIEQERRLPSPACQESLGYSIDERLVPRLASKRRYWFSPKPWSAISFASLSQQPF